MKKCDVMVKKLEYQIIIKSYILTGCPILLTLSQTKLNLVNTKIQK